MRYEIVMDHGETGNKCTIAPLRGRPDFRFFRVHGERPLGPLSAPILLHHEGECLTQVDLTKPVQSLASIDCVWRRLPTIQRRLSWIEAPAKLAKLPEGFVTVYPRVGQYLPDPEGGLATIEALFIAAALLGKWDVTLLAHYYFARAFIERNAKRFVELGVQAAADQMLWPPEKPLVRTSLSRRINRGQIQVYSK